MGTGNKSWWVTGGPGCSVGTPSNGVTGTNATVSTMTTTVPGCILQYYYVEVIHAAIEVFFAVSKTFSVHR